MKLHTGAAGVVAFDFNVRNRDLAQAHPGVQKPVTFVHNDYTHDSGPQRVRDIIGGPEAEGVSESVLPSLMCGSLSLGRRRDHLWPFVMLVR